MADNDTYAVTRPTTVQAAPARVYEQVKSMDKLVGPDFEKGLAKLKRVSEGATSG